MKLTYSAKRTSPDILLPLSFLASRMKEPNNHDEVELTRVCFIIQPSSPRIFAWIDASYAVHSNARSHTGIIIGLGGHKGLVYFRSSVQKLVADSSTYAELIAQHDGLHTVQWITFVMAELGYPVTGDVVPVVYHDNNSAMHLANRGPGAVARSKHFLVRYFYVKELIDAKVIHLQHLPTPDMLADSLTKPNQGRIFRVRVCFLLVYNVA